MDEDLADHRGRCRGRSEDPECRAQAPSARVGYLVCRATPEIGDRDGEVEAEQHDRRADAEHGERVAIRVAVPPGDRRDQQQHHGDDDKAQLAEQRAPVELCVVLAEDQRRTEHEQDVRDDAAGHRATHDIRQVVRNRDQGDDDLGRVSEARVQQTADAWARVFSRVFGRLPDQPGQGDQRERGQHEQGRLVRVDEDIDEYRDRRERERSPEESSRHRSLA